MYRLLVIAALAIVPQDCVARDGVDALETSHVYTPDGSFVLRQFCGVEDSHYRFWKMQPDASIRVWRDHARGGWVALWQDGDITRVVRAASYSQRWDGFDPETYDRQFLPAEQRRKLKGQP